MEVDYTSEIKQAADTDLFLMMAYKDDDYEKAEQAFEEFHKRYKDFVYNVCRKFCKNVNSGNSIIKDIFNDTMFSVWENAIKFDDAGSSNEMELKLRVMGWLTAIIRNKVNEMFRNDADLKLVLNEELIHFNPSSKQRSAGTPSYKEQQAKMGDALLKLTERERDIVLTYYMFDQEGKYSPRDVIKDLCDRYDTTPENIRQIRKRALDKLKSYFQ